MMNKLIVVSGPTASGKTKTSIEIACAIKEDLKQKVAVVNFDSLLFYQEISIGTAKPTVTERRGIDHYMLDIVSISSPLNAADFIKRAKEILEELFQQNTICILVGGSAFYLRALLKGMYESPAPSPEIKKQVDEWYQGQGIAPFLDYLKKHDPESLVNLHTNDHYRLMRAVEHHLTNGTKISDQKKVMDDQNPYDFSSIEHPWDVLHLYLDLPKEQHYQIIQQRTAQMFTDGLMNEIESLEKSGFSLTEKPLASIGYKEAIEYKNQQFKNADECMERISISTRQLAKSQRTFFNKITPKESFNPLTDQAKIRQRVMLFLEEQK